MRLSYKYLTMVVPALWLVGCAAQPELELPSDRIVRRPEPINIDSNVVAKCHSPITSLLPGAYKQTDTNLLNIIKDAGDETMRAECADAMADFLDKSMGNSTNNFSLAKRHDEEMDFDVLIVGAGVHGSILARNLSLDKPDARILMIDKVQYPAEHFHTYAFRLNSPSAPKNTNAFPNSPVDITDYLTPIANTPSTFPIARRLWNQIIFNNFATNALIFLQTEIKKFDRINDGYLVELTGPNKLSPGRTIAVKKIVLATSWGQELLPYSKNTAWFTSQRNLANSYTNSSSALPKVMTYEDMLRINEILHKEGRSIAEYFDGKDVAIAGAGDSGKITVELLLGYAPAQTYVGIGKQDLYRKPNALLWLGQKSSDYIQFENSPETKKRYKNNGFMRIFAQRDVRNQAFILETVAAKVKEVNPTTSGKVEVTAEDGSLPKAVDFVICAIGYKNNINDMLKNKALFLADFPANQNLFFEKIGHSVIAQKYLSETYETVATRLCLPGRNCESIYVVGTAAGNALDVSKLRYEQTVTKNPASIETLAPLTEAFANYLMNLLII